MGKNKYIVNENAFIAENEISFYLLGAYMTDGCVRKQNNLNGFSISSKDYEWMDMIRYLGADFSNAKMPILKIKNCFSLTMTSKVVKDWFISWGCTPAKSLTLSINKTIPEKYVPSFLRGVMDGDGCITYGERTKICKNKKYTYLAPTCYIASASKHFLEQVQDLLPKNIKSRIRTIKPSTHFSKSENRNINGKSETYRLTFQYLACKDILEYVYRGEFGLALTRKMVKAKFICDHYNNKFTRKPRTTVVK
jgi:hypothetical protein